MGMSRDAASRMMRRAGMPDAAIEQRLGPERGQSKYHANRTFSEVFHRQFHSDAERRYAEHLHWLQEKGKISGLELQKRVKLMGCVTMLVDFYYIEDGSEVWNEFKGFPTDKWKLQVKLWEQVGPGEYRVTREVKSDRFDPYRHDRIFPKPSQELIDQIKPYC
jgi:hypothetical protein